MQIERFSEMVDDSVRPQDDFFSYANGEWLKNNEIPDDKVRWGSFIILHEKSLKDVKTVLETDYQDEEFNNARIFYKTAMDKKRLEDEDFDPVKPYMEKIDSVNTKEELITVLIDLHAVGLVDLWNLSSEIDRKNTEIEVPHLEAGGISLPNKTGATNKDYYLEEDKEEIRESYVGYLQTLFHNIAIPVDQTDTIAREVLKFETELAKHHYSQVDKRDPETTYHKMNMGELNELVPLMDWDKFFTAFTDKKIQYVIIDNPDYFKFTNQLLENKDISIWKHYLKAKILNLSAQFMSKKFSLASFKLYQQKISGQKKELPRWKRIVQIANNRFVIGHLVGKMYVKEYFPPASKEQMVELVNNLIDAFRERLLALNWMSEETKQKALEKLDVFNTKIGYPDEWEDYSDLNLSERNSFFENYLKARRYVKDISLSRLFDSPDPHYWWMSPQTVNAYFHPFRNEIVFPAAILQFPFFDPKMSAAENYGGIGGVIAHEITHGYDDKGAKFDFKGNLKNWWTENDAKQFSELGEYFEKQYEEFMIGGKPLNGKLTLGENIADHGGVRIAFHALQKHFEKNGRPEENGKFTPEEKFFLSWARIWRSKERPEFEEKMRSSDPHSPPKARVNVTLANVEEFRDTFNLQPNDKLYRENMVELW